MLWARAMRAIITDPRIIKDVMDQRDSNPHQISGKDFDRVFFSKCAWAVYTAGIKFKMVENKWKAIEEAFLHWDYQQVCRNEDNVRTAALSVVKNIRKANATIKIAQWMCETGWVTIRKRLLDGLTQDGLGNFVPGHELIAYLDERPMIGETNAIFLAKMIGYDLAKPDILLKRLATKFGYPPNKNGVQQLATDISQLVLQRISVVETVLWNACNSKKDDLGFKCPTCGKEY